MISLVYNACIPEGLYEEIKKHDFPSLLGPEKEEITGRLNPGKREFLRRNANQYETETYGESDHREIRYGEVVDWLIERGFYPSVRPIRWGEETKWASEWVEIGFLGSTEDLSDTPREALDKAIQYCLDQLE